METRSYRPKRSVRHAEMEAQRPPRPTPRHVVGRLERERRLQRLALVGAAVVVLLVILIPGYGYWKDVLHVGDEPLVVVDGQSVTVGDYARYLGTRQSILTRQITQAQAAIPAITPAARPVGTPSASATPVSTPSAEQVAAQQTLDTLTSQQSGLSTTALTELVEARLLLDEAKKRNLTVSPAEMDNALRWVMSRPSLGADQAFGLLAAPTSLPSDAVSLDQAHQTLKEVVGKGNYLSEAQIDELILKPAVIKAKLIAELAKDQPKTAEQVHVRHILVKTEDEAKAIRQQLENGADFATLAQKNSIDDGTKNKGGDLGWFGKGTMVPEFEAAAFSLRPGEVSQPVKSQFGYHILQVLEKDPNRPLDAGQLAQALRKSYDDWLNQQVSDATKVSYQVSSPKMNWIRSYTEKGN